MYYVKGVSGSFPKPIDWTENGFGCFVCISHARDKDGYPLIWRNRKQNRMSHIVWEECFGDIPNGLWILHKCDNPSCINPEHLFLGNAKDNGIDKAKKGRSAKGLEHGMAKLTDQQVEEIRNARGFQKDIAARYGICQVHVSSIKLNKRRVCFN